VSKGGGAEPGNGGFNVGVFLKQGIQIASILVNVPCVYINAVLSDLYCIHTSVHLEIIE
jgi:hypothetical protein